MPPLPLNVRTLSLKRTLSVPPAKLWLNRRPPLKRPLLNCLPPWLDERLLSKKELKNSVFLYFCKPLLLNFSICVAMIQNKLLYYRYIFKQDGIKYFSDLLNKNLRGWSSIKVFFSESVIRFSNLQISKKNTPNHYPELEIWNSRP